MDPSTPASRDPDPGLVAASRGAWRGLEILHLVGYFAEEPTAAYVALGLDPRLSYFAARGAALGAVGPKVTEATFYVFAPWLHEAALPAAWSVTTPEELVRTRHESVAAALHRLLGEPDVSEALGLARQVCAGLTVPGRTLYAAHAQLAWPEDPLLALWHAATLVREHRGDGHLGVLLAHGVGPVEATVLDGVWSDKDNFLRKTRGWTEEEYTAAAKRLLDRGWLDADGALSHAGRAAREEIEAATDRASLEGWAALGTSGCRRLAALLAPFVETVLDSGALPRGVQRALRASG